MPPKKNLSIRLLALIHVVITIFFQQIFLFIFPLTILGAISKLSPSANFFLDNYIHYIIFIFTLVSIIIGLIISSIIINKFFIIQNSNKLINTSLLFYFLIAVYTILTQILNKDAYINNLPAYFLYLNFSSIILSYILFYFFSKKCLKNEPMAEKTTAIEKLPTGKLYKKLFIFGLKISLIHLFLIFSFLFNKGHSDIVFLLAPLSFICWGGCPDLFIIFIFLLSSIFAGLIFSIIYYFYISFKKTNKIYKKAILFGLTTTITYPFLIFGIIFWGYRPVFLLGPFAFFYDDNRASFLFLIFLASIFAGLVLGIIYYVITKKRSIQS